MTFRQWVWNRAREGSSWVGAFMVLTGNWGLSSTNSGVQNALTIYNSYAPQIGALLVAASTRHP